jgi:hypothetical protein
MKKKYWHVYADDEGESHVEELEADLRLTNYAPPAPPGYVSDPSAAAGFLYLALPAGWTGDWHPTPGRQLQVLLRGHAELIASDRGSFTAGPGQVALLEDARGRGHQSRAVGDGPAEILAVILP